MGDSLKFAPRQISPNDLPVKYREPLLNDVKNIMAGSSEGANSTSYAFRARANGGRDIIIGLPSNIRSINKDSNKALKTFCDKYGVTAKDLIKNEKTGRLVIVIDTKNIRKYYDPGMRGKIKLNNSNEVFDYKVSFEIKDDQLTTVVSVGHRDASGKFTGQSWRDNTLDIKDINNPDFKDKAQNITDSFLKKFAESHKADVIDTKPTDDFVAPTKIGDTYPAMGTYGPVNPSKPKTESTNMSRSIADGRIGKLNTTSYEDIVVQKFSSQRKDFMQRTGKEPDLKETGEMLSDAIKQTAYDNPSYRKNLATNPQKALQDINKHLENLSKGKNRQQYLGLSPSKVEERMQVILADDSFKSATSQARSNSTIQ